MGRYGDSGRDSTAKTQHEAHEADGFKLDEKANSDFINRWTNEMDEPPIVDKESTILLCRMLLLN